MAGSAAQGPHRAMKALCRAPCGDMGPISSGEKPVAVEASFPNRDQLSRLDHAGSESASSRARSRRRRWVARTTARVAKNAIARMTTMTTGVMIKPGRLNSDALILPRSILRTGDRAFDSNAYCVPPRFVCRAFRSPAGSTYLGRTPRVCRPFGGHSVSSPGVRVSFRRFSFTGTRFCWQYGIDGPERPRPRGERRCERS